MDCDVEEVPSTDSELTGSADSASAITCSSSSRSTLSSISNASWAGPTAKKLQNGGRTVPRNHLSGPTSLKIRITRTQYVLSASYPPSVS